MKSSQPDTGRIWPVAVTGLAALIRLVSVLNLGVHTDEAGRLASVTLPGVPFASGAAAAYQGAVGAAWIYREIYLATGSLFWLRLVPLAAGTLAVFLFAQMARRELDREPAILASVLFAVLPLSVLYSTVAEEYAFTSLFALAGMRVALGIRREPAGSGRRFPEIALIAVAGLFLGGFTFLPWWLGLAIAVAAVAGRSFTRRDWLGLAGAQLPMLCLLAWTFSMLEPVKGAHEGLLRFWGFDMARSDPAALVADLWLHVNAWFWIRPAPAKLIAAEILIAAWVVWIVYQGGRRPNARLWILAAVLGFAIPSVLTGVAFGHPFYYSRTYLPVTIPLAVLFARGVQTFGRMKLWGGLLVAGALASTILLVSGRHPSYPPLLGTLYSKLAENTPNHAAVAISPWIMAESLVVGCRLTDGCTVTFQRACHPDAISLEDYRDPGEWRLDDRSRKQCAENIRTGGWCLFSVPSLGALVEGEKPLSDYLDVYRRLSLMPGLKLYCP